MMLSESARATTAAEARFRIQAPNARPRIVAVVPLDDAAHAMLSGLGSERTIFVTLAEGAAWIAQLSDRTRALVQAIETANLIVLVATAGADASAAAMVAEAGAARRVMIAGLVVDSAGTDAGALEKSLAALRPHVGMLVVAEGRDYLGPMLEALRA